MTEKVTVVRNNAALQWAINERNCLSDVGTCNSFLRKFFARGISCFNSFSLVQCAFANSFKCPSDRNLWPPGQRAELPEKTCSSIIAENTYKVLRDYETCVDRLESEVTNLLRKMLRSRIHQDAEHTNAISINSDKVADIMSSCILLLGQATIWRQKYNPVPLHTEIHGRSIFPFLRLFLVSNWIFHQQTTGAILSNFTKDPSNHWFESS